MKIKIWFQNRRAKDRKLSKKKKSDSSMLSLSHVNHSLVDLANQQQHHQQIEAKNTYNYPSDGLTTTATTSNWLIEENDFNNNNNSNNKVMVSNNHTTSFGTDQLINDSYNFYSNNMNRFN